ncbi:MAG TPA: DNA-processing protein DprA [Candidatus Limnocylindria bacterium]|nr:DNA-processing protein DprA [Candidatus Limnocylindria bacterium]
MIGAVGGMAGGASAAARWTERDAWIALTTVPGLGPAGFARLVRHHGSASAAWTGGAAGARAAGLPAAVADALGERRDVDPGRLAARLAAAVADHGGRIVAALDAEYPRALLTLDPRPAVLYVAGDLGAFERRAVAIVGTRRASGYGLAATAQIGDDLARAGLAIVSGLALGIDGAAHRAAVAAGAPTIAVLPSPLDRIYPPRHRHLAREIVAGGGLLVSEMPIGAVVGRPDFARRNRIIAGLAEAVIVVEAPDRSGALLTAAAAAAIGRELYAVPGPIDAMASRGCNRLIADNQAAIVTSSAALLAQIGLRRTARPAAVESLSEVEGMLLERLLERSGSIEELVDRTHQPPAAVASGLALLEARGLVDPFGGATYHPTLAARRMAGVA